MDQRSIAAADYLAEITTSLGMIINICKLLLVGFALAELVV
jgi:hypothetical protein